MLNPDFRLATGATSGTLGVVWIAHAADAVSFVYVNGRLEAETFAPGQAERCIDVPLAPGSLAVIEVHDFDSGDLPEAPAAVTIPPTAYTRPMIRFAAVPGAVRYRLYHRPESGIEMRAWEAAANPDDGEWISLECPVDLDGRSANAGYVGGWHFFRVEAVSAYGFESLAQAWAWRALDVPAAPRVAVVLGDEPGVFTFTVFGG